MRVKFESQERTEGSWWAAAAPAGLGAPAPGALWLLAWFKEVPAWALVEAALPASTSVCPSLPPLECQQMLSRQTNACSDKVTPVAVDQSLLQP